MRRGLTTVRRGGGASLTDELEKASPACVDATISASRAALSSPRAWTARRLAGIARIAASACASENGLALRDTYASICRVR